jgi:hypothetical protein
MGLWISDRGFLISQPRGLDMLRILTVGSCLLMFGNVCLADEAVKEAAVGKPAPDFSATGIDGEQFTLSEKTASGKNIVLMFSRAHW